MKETNYHMAIKVGDKVRIEVKKVDNSSGV
jgi:hypothetical protein